MGRGNLFIYTLPTSAIAEVSIHFGVTGPSLFIEADVAPFERLLAEASQMLEKAETETAALLWQDKQYTLCTVADHKTPKNISICSLKKLETSAACRHCPEDAIRDIVY